MKGPHKRTSSLAITSVNENNNITRSRESRSASVPGSGRVYSRRYRSANWICFTFYITRKMSDKKFEGAIVFSEYEFEIEVKCRNESQSSIYGEMRLLCLRMLSAKYIHITVSIVEEPRNATHTNRSAWIKRTTEYTGSVEKSIVFKWERRWTLSIRNVWKSGYILLYVRFVIRPSLVNGSRKKINIIMYVIDRE